MGFGLLFKVYSKLCHAQLVLSSEVCKRSLMKADWLSSREAVIALIWGRRLRRGSGEKLVADRNCWIFGMTAVRFLCTYSLSASCIVTVLYHTPTLELPQMFI
jgi:hypothetical protein